MARLIEISHQQWATDSQSRLFPFVRLPRPSTIFFRCGHFAYSTEVLESVFFVLPSPNLMLSRYDLPGQMVQINRCAARLKEQATALPAPLFVDETRLHTFPDSAGLQHSEVESLREKWPYWWPWKLSWPTQACVHRRS